MFKYNESDKTGDKQIDKLIETMEFETKGVVTLLYKEGLPEDKPCYFIRINKSTLMSFSRKKRNEFICFVKGFNIATNLRLG